MRLDGVVIPMHVHPQQEERIAVLSGTVRSRSGERDQLVEAGKTVVTPPGEAHTIEPVAGRDAEVRVKLRPVKYAEFIERSFALDRAGHVNAKGRANPLRIATARPAEAEFFLAGPPIVLQKPLLGLLGQLARALRYDRA